MNVLDIGVFGTFERESDIVDGCWFVMFSNLLACPATVPVI